MNVGAKGYVRPSVGCGAEGEGFSSAGRADNVGAARQSVGQFASSEVNIVQAAAVIAGQSMGTPKQWRTFAFCDGFIDADDTGGIDTVAPAGSQ